MAVFINPRNKARGSITSRTGPIRCLTTSQSGATNRVAREGALAPLSVGWRHRELILAVLRRELADRFSGFAFGWVWAVEGPLITLGNIR